MGRNNYSIFIPVFINVCHNIVVVLQDNSLPRKIYSQIYCFCGLYYGTVYTAKNITIAIILSFTLIILSLSGGNLFNAIIPWYIDVHSVKTLASFMKEYIILGSAGCILGFFSNHRYSDYQ